MVGLSYLPPLFYFSYGTKIGKINKNTKFNFQIEYYISIVGYMIDIGFRYIGIGKRFKINVFYMVV